MPNIMMTDPLADVYNSLLDKYNVKTHYRPIKVDFCDEVEVKRALQGETFDMVHSRSALDHSYAPDKAIRNMLLRLKEQGICNIRMVINEGTSAKFHGLHKWDFGISGEHGVTITNQDRSVVISIQDIINGLGSSDKFKVCYVFSTDFTWKQEIRTSSWLHFAIFKNYDDNEIDKYYNKMQKLALEETEKFREEAQKRLWETRDKMRKAQARLNELGEKIPE